MLSNIEKIETATGHYDYLQSLNFRQQIAASQMEGNHLVLAGPGTGKTHTLAYRTMHLINSGVDPQTICLITFTRKAAKSIRDRMNSLMPGVEIGFIGTFHALATELLTNTNHLQNWRLIDGQDDNALIDLTCKSGPIGTAKLSQIFSYHANTQKSMEDVLVDLNLEKYSVYAPKIELAYRHYLDIKRRHGYLNYDDLLLMPIANPSLCQQANFDYLMIDEFQDVSLSQVEFVKALNVANVMAIGDDFQNIYSFRGSDNELILNLDQHFANCKLITLSVNYRSSINITKSINQVVEQTDFGYNKYVTSNFEDDQPNADVIIYDGLTNSAEKIVQSIENDPGEHAILYRRSKMRTKIEAELIKAQIPYKIYGGLNLLERKHIKDLIAIISLINNPHDYIAHIHVLMLNKEISEQDAIEMINSISFDGENNLPTAALTDYSLKTMEQVLDLAIDYYQSNYCTSVNLDMVSNDFAIIRDITKDYTHILAFINDFTLDFKADFSSDDEQDIRVILSTFHASKGLEFDNVHILYGFNDFKPQTLSQIEEEARLFYVAMSRAKYKLEIYDNYSSVRTLNDLINDFIDTPLRENYELNFDDQDISDVEKVTLHLEQDEIEFQEVNEQRVLNFKTVLDYFRK